MLEFDDVLSICSESSVNTLQFENAALHFPMEFSFRVRRYAALLPSESQGKKYKNIQYKAQ
jgi:hypothetical protein